MANIFEKPVNNRWIQLSGKINIPSDLEEGDLTIKVTGSVIVGDMRDNQDGTVDRVYKFKTISVDL